MPPNLTASFGSHDTEPENGPPGSPHRGAESPSVANSRHCDIPETSHSELPEEKNEEIRSHYEVLGVPTDASPEEIRRIYYGLCKVYHPDKSSSSVYATRLCAIQQAYTVLSDETKRLLYDIRIGVYKGKDKWTKVAEVYQIQRERAARDIENMRIDYQTKLEHESKVGGLIIRKALYGNLRLRRSLLEQEYTDGKPKSLLLLSSGPIREDCLEGPFLNVTIPLQVHEHDVCLYVLYDFRGVLHEVTVCDRSYLAIPLKSHRVSPATGPRGPYAPSNVLSLRARWNEKTTARHSLDSGAQKLQSLGEAKQRELALREEQKMRDRRLGCFLLWSSIFTWSGLFLYASAYDKEKARSFISRAIGDGAATRCAILLPPTLSPSIREAWLRILRFEFLSAMWPFTVLRNWALADRGSGQLTGVDAFPK
ncbi:putative DnaJ domain-containing protein [Neospora caninum Liverpool]|uniref:Putative DnaJ domain-containing protein n=1 Tax=Neospora caninum (strain Liverpool) TaxID=572307 RepID=F0VEF8_NEOCL|nr:putative DnaJ domain-containing protein [Neospora caninum Liverpool]CBZ52102.1 putative DnaJ domain-containing protein [Neospora caninum Liverpool]|eukprot:XP_003882134.1 putative DnaJ domain-containing protein [Neospora caninum Liverpool]